jgi:hypothetical protein
MNAASPLQDDAGRSGARLAIGLLTGAALLAVVDAGVIAATVPLPSAGMGLRLTHLFFDAAETLGVGGVAALIVVAVGRFLRLPRLAAFGIAAVATMALMEAAVGHNITRGVQFTVPGRLAPAAHTAYLLALGLLIPEAYLVAARLALRPQARSLLFALAVLVLGVDAAIGRDDYQGLHAVAACGAATLAGTALAPWVERRLFDGLGRARGRIVLGAVALFALAGILVPPPNAVRYELFRPACAVAPWVLATVLWRVPPLHAPVALEPSPWSRDRSGGPAVAPTTPRLLPEDAVVVLVTIDAVRADVVADPANDVLFPTLAALKRQGVVFTRASAAGSQTPVSLSALFSGRPFSEQLWTPHGEGRTRFLFPAEDPSVRFPAILSDHGVATLDVAGLSFLTGEYGVLRGFREEAIVAQGVVHAKGSDLVDRIVDRLRRMRQGPAFLYTHLMEPHEPYDRGRRTGTDWERYLSEIAVADGQLARILRLLEARFPKRWALLVSADHGEAFGEHGTHQHAKSLYEELVHVPLIAASPLFVPRTVDVRVGLVDLGPTLLDLFGLDTPATFLGQSLVPILAGGEAALTRPLFSEGRLRRALTMPDGLKVIEDPRRKLVELYDVPNDPGETRNLFDVEPERSDVALATLRAFFAAHTRTADGYEAPYEP